MPYADPDKQREYMRVWVAARRKAYFADKCCVVCGSTEELQLDHIEPEKKVSHKIWSWSEERRLAEIAKCQVLCVVCHQKKSFEQRPVKTQHGAIGMYRNGCRCEPCKEVNRARVARQRPGRPTGRVPAL